MIKIATFLAIVGYASAGAITYGNVGLGGLGYASHAVAAPALAYGGVRAVSHAVAAPQYAVAAPQYAVAAPRYAVAAPQLIQRQVIAQPQLIQQQVVKAVAPEPFDPHPQYNFGYSVSDALTGDQKSQHESRDGDVVQGQYSLVEPDGAVRTVTYTADAVNGFNAVVDRSAPQVAVKAVHAVQPVAVRQQVLAHAPVATYAAHAPVVAHHGAVGYAGLSHGLVGGLGVAHAPVAYGGLSHGLGVSHLGGAYLH